MADYMTERWRDMPVAPQSAGEIYVSHSRGNVPSGPVPAAITLAGGDKVFMDWLPHGCVIDKFLVKGIGGGFSGALKIDSLGDKPPATLMNLNAGTLTDGNWHYDGRFVDWPSLIDMKTYSELYIEIAANPGTNYEMVLYYRTEQAEDKSVCYIEAKP